MNNIEDLDFLDEGIDFLPKATDDSETDDGFSEDGLGLEMTSEEVEERINIRLRKLFDFWERSLV